MLFQHVSDLMTVLLGFSEYYVFCIFFASDLVPNATPKVEKMFVDQLRVSGGFLALPKHGRR